MGFMAMLAACFVVVSLATPIADDSICCACSKGSDMGSDLWYFTKASHGQDCTSCCSQQLGYVSGKGESAPTCMNSPFPPTNCMELTETAAPAQTYHMYSQTTTLDSFDATCYQMDSRLQGMAAVALELEAAIKGLNILWPLQDRNNTNVTKGACVCGCESPGCGASGGYAHQCQTLCGSSTSRAVLGVNLTTVPVCKQDQS